MTYIYFRSVFDVCHFSLSSILAMTCIKPSFIIREDRLFHRGCIIELICAQTFDKDWYNGFIKIWNVSEAFIYAAV